MSSSSGFSNEYIEAFEGAYGPGADTEEARRLNAAVPPAVIPVGVREVLLDILWTTGSFTGRVFGTSALTA